MSPERFVPEKFGLKNSAPTPEADIYAFGLVIWQVYQWRDLGYLRFAYVVQVLTGELPFPGLQLAEIARDVIQGVRPAKPGDASAIGFSDSLWSFVQRCWDEKMELRPKVGEVVAQLERAAADWNRVMPPYLQVESVTSASPEPVSGSAVHGEFEILIIL